MINFGYFVYRKDQPSWDLFYSGDSCYFMNKTYGSESALKGYEEFIENPENKKISTGDATATPQDIIAGKTAYAKAIKLTGTYHPLDTSDATATEKDITMGKTAYVNGVKITGTLE